MQNGLYHLVGVAILLSPSGEIKTGISGLEPLPQVVSDRVMRGEQFGIVIREYSESIQDSDDKLYLARIESLINRRKCFEGALRIVVDKVKSS